MSPEESWLLHEKYNGEKTEGFFADCVRLQTGEPLAYLIGHIPFIGTKIFLDSKPLIPRTETEFWVNSAIHEIRNAPFKNPKILDLCAGSGCIGVAVLKAIPMAHVDFSEIDVSHHATIKKNLLENQINLERVHIYGGDLFSEIIDTYDFILSNPPYIDKESNHIDESVLTQEPHNALFGGVLGMELITRIIADAPSRLTEGGVLYIEHEPEQTALIQTHALENEFVATTNEDQYHVLRYTRFTRKSI